MNLWAGVGVALAMMTLLTVGGLDAEVSLDFCGFTCPQVDNIIKGEVARKQAAAGLVRIIFVDGPTAQHKADINLPLSADGFDAKNAVEAQCPVVASCANIGAIETRDLLTLAFVRAWYTACKKPADMLLEPTNKKLSRNKLFFQGPCQPGFIFKIDPGMIAAVQNPETRKNDNKWLQFDKVESFTLMGKGYGTNMWAGQRFMEHTRVNVRESVVKGRTLLEPTKPDSNRGHGAHHH